MLILLIVYIILGYWAAGKTIYANSIAFGRMSDIIARRMACGFVLGWILIPIALIRVIFHI